MSYPDHPGLLPGDDRGRPRQAGPRAHHSDATASDRSATQELPFGTVLAPAAPPFASGRSTDPITSHQAAESLSTDVLAKRCRQALLAMAHMGGTAIAGDIANWWETETGKRQERGPWSRRCTDLRDRELIEDSGERRESESGRPCIVWRITEAGYRVLGPKENW